MSQSREQTVKLPLDVLEKIVANGGAPNVQEAAERAVYYYCEVIAVERKKREAESVLPKSESDIW